MVEQVNLTLQIDSLEEQEIHLLSVQLKDKMVDKVLVEQQVQIVVQALEVAEEQVVKE